MDIENLNELKVLVNSKNVNNFVDEYGRNLLQNAIIDNPMAIDFLIEVGIDINHIDSNKQNALHFCAEYANYELAELLLKKGIYKNQKDIYGNTPMWRAVFNADGEYSLVKLLKKYDCDFLSKNNNNKSPLDFAIQIGDNELQNILLRN
ncbi:ankyrin repeat domain-containing protein [Riemerella anatipestifer]|uniref:ankyrin repeat domain-containing protein n=1 Tax=Riemerella anatipestifer TaxID=34085 RepID=UPI002A864DF2|nr:ankyrin repeat domain-containing protein [Riemerella anatipestifer]